MAERIRLITMLSRYLAALQIQLPLLFPDVMVVGVANYYDKARMEGEGKCLRGAGLFNTKSIFHL